MLYAQFLADALSWGRPYGTGAYRIDMQPISHSNRTTPIEPQALSLLQQSPRCQVPTRRSYCIGAAASETSVPYLTPTRRTPATTSGAVSAPAAPRVPYPCPAPPKPLRGHLAVLPTLLVRGCAGPSS